MTRFRDLLHDIRYQELDEKGAPGKWIKASKHSHFYDDINPDHTDTKGWKWWREIEDEYEAGNIIIYKQRNNHNWFVLPEYEREFRNVYPDFYRK